MKAKILRLNAAYTQGKLDYESYKAKVKALLRTLDWQTSIQYQNMTLI